MASNTTQPMPNLGTDSNNPLNSPFLNCTICQKYDEGEDAASLVILTCGHRFHAKCITTLNDHHKNGQNCPYCSKRYCHSTCGHPPDRQNLQPGADLRSLPPLCKFCNLLRQLNQFQPTIQRLLVVMGEAYPDETQGPIADTSKDPNVTYMRDVRREEFHRTSSCLQQWISRWVPMIAEIMSTREIKTDLSFLDEVKLVLCQLGGLFATMFPPVQNASILFGHLQIEPTLSAGDIGSYYRCLQLLGKIMNKDGEDVQWGPCSYYSSVETSGFL